MAIKLLDYRGEVSLKSEIDGNGQLVLAEPDLWKIVITFPDAYPGAMAFQVPPSMDGRESANDLHWFIAEASEELGDDWHKFYDWTRRFVANWGNPYHSELFLKKARANFSLGNWRGDMRTIADYTAKAQTVAGRKWLLTVGAPGKITPSERSAPINYRLMYNCSAVLVEPRGGGRPDLKAKSTGIKLDVAMQPNNLIGWCYGLIARDAELVIRYKKCANKKGCNRKVPSITPGNNSGALYCSSPCRKAVEVGRRK